jgi:adenylosuccinate lyase
MIPRYSRPAMAAVWDEEARFQTWLDVELAVSETLEELGRIPAGTAGRMRANARFDAARIAEREAVLQHDVVAFLTDVAESLGEDGRWLHWGMTSSDLLDTALALQLRRAGGILLADLDGVLDALRVQAERHRRTVMVGRTHGVHAEPITFGLKLAGFHDEFARARARLEAALEAACVGKLSGAVGTYAHLPPDVEPRALARLGIRAASFSSQVVPRDRLASLVAAVALAGCAVERFAVEIRHLQRSEVLEAEEPFGEGQKGSSAMPHKRNPILCERLSGMARLLRGYTVPAFEDVALWHERDISHSSVERVIVPDATILLDTMLHTLLGVVNGLRVHAERMRENLGRWGDLVFSGGVLLALTDALESRERAYAIVQRHALAAFPSGPPFRAALEADPEVRAALSPEVLASCFDLDAALGQVDAAFAKAMGAPPR